MLCYHKNFIFELQITDSLQNFIRFLKIDSNFKSFLSSTIPISTKSREGRWVHIESENTSIVRKSGPLMSPILLHRGLNVYDPINGQPLSDSEGQTCLSIALSPPCTYCVYQSWLCNNVERINKVLCGNMKSGWVDGVRDDFMSLVWLYLGGIIMVGVGNMFGVSDKLLYLIWLVALMSRSMDILVKLRNVPTGELVD